MSPADKAREGDGSPPTAAGAVLHTMYRRVRLTRLVVLGALATGPLALTVAVMSPSSTVSAAPKPTPVKLPVAPADPSGYAEVFLAAWLRSGGKDADAQARVAQAMAPSVALPGPVADAQPVRDVHAVRSAQHRDGRWSVTVAAQYPDGTVRYFAVPVVADKSGGAFAVEEAPGRVAGPVTAEVAASAYGVSLPSDSELTRTAGEFLKAYLSGEGQVDRYLAPGLSLDGVTSAGYKEVQVQEATADIDAAAAEQVPADGTKVRLLVEVTATDASGEWPLSYELEMSTRAGRWEVAALLSGATGTGGDGS
ncbi:conjugal transfer protein [Streptomyces sp. YC504]|uniref:Conjugal transfer protein n=1 Tax=Streptomyces mesophilus TaxID=1775132 RepID=A0A6G4XS32_9ACTN|nr:conjugal transfer protein [Streptomyces mesophilus]NGO79514.1 conjugal transfer protein [Streptomyces mesophilus]